MHTVRAAGATSGALFGCLSNRLCKIATTRGNNHRSCLAASLCKLSCRSFRANHEGLDQAQPRPRQPPVARPVRGHQDTREPGSRSEKFSAESRPLGLSGKQSQILSRSLTMQAVLPVLQSGSRRPRSSPATPSAAPCGARGSNKRRASRGSRGLAPLQSGNFQDLTRVDCRILVTLDCKILVTARAIRALHRRARALTARAGAGVNGAMVQG